MSIAFAILGFLVARPHSGYDLKNRFAESESLPWAGNKQPANPHYSASATLPFNTHRTSEPLRLAVAGLLCEGMRPASTGSVWQSPWKVAGRSRHASRG